MIGYMQVIQGIQEAADRHVCEVQFSSGEDCSCQGSNYTLVEDAVPSELAGLGMQSSEWGRFKQEAEDAVNAAEKDASKKGQTAALLGIFAMLACILYVLVRDDHMPQSMDLGSIKTALEDVFDQGTSRSLGTINTTFLLWMFSSVIYMIYTRSKMATNINLELEGISQRYLARYQVKAAYIQGGKRTRTRLLFHKPRSDDPAARLNP